MRTRTSCSGSVASRRGGRRRPVLAAVAAGVAVVLVAASGAMACTWFQGKFRLVGNAPLGGPVVAIGTGRSMQWCQSPTGTAKSTSDNGTVKVVVKPAPSRCVRTAAAAKLPKGTYDINFVNGAAVSTAPRQMLIDCMSGLAAPGIVALGAMFVNKAGLGTKTFALPSGLVANGPSDESAVCISDPGGQFGNQAPLTIV